ncbi:MAG: hypothetical protein ACQGVC_19150 [Myxococcota bacterium]
MKRTRVPLLLAVVLFLVLPALPAGAEPVDLSNHEKSVYSQAGEDGVLEKIFQLIEPGPRYAVEFGAGDGVQNSNVRHLYEQGWSGLQIEGSPVEFAKLKKNYAELPRVTNLLAWVWPGNIEFLFEKHGVPKDLDLLVIDIDSNDYWIWKVIHEFRPKVVLIEYNAAFAPPQRAVVRYHPMNHADSTDYYGASIQSLYELGKRKGYELVYGNRAGINLFFVDAPYYARFGLADNSPERFYRPPGFGYDEGGRAPNGRGWPKAETKGPLRYPAGRIPKVFVGEPAGPETAD